MYGLKIISINEDKFERFKYLHFKWDDEMGVMPLQLVAKRIRYSRHSSIHSQGFQALSCECVDGMASKSMMMCLDHAQKWLDFGQAVSFFLHLTQFLFSEMSLWVYAEFTTGILKTTEKNVCHYGLMMSQGWKPHYIFKEKYVKPVAEGSATITYIKHSYCW